MMMMMMILTLASVRVMIEPGKSASLTMVIRVSDIASYWPAICENALKLFTFFFS